MSVENQLIRCIYGACVRAAPSVRNCNSHCTFSAQRTIAAERQAVAPPEIVRILEGVLANEPLTNYAAERLRLALKLARQLSRP